MEPVTTLAAPQNVNFILSRIPGGAETDTLRGTPDWCARFLLIVSGWMLRKLTVIGVFLATLAPSAYLAWTLRTMPHLGFYHDDSLYWVSGRSLAMGNGYRI